MILSIRHAQVIRHGPGRCLAVPIAHFLNFCRDKLVMFLLIMSNSLTFQVSDIIFCGNVQS
jgi:hypothetical protein